MKVLNLKYAKIVFDFKTFLYNFTKLPLMHKIFILVSLSTSRLNIIFLLFSMNYNLLLLKLIYKYKHLGL